MLPAVQLLVHDRRSTQMLSCKHFALNYYNNTEFRRNKFSNLRRYFSQIPNITKFQMNEKLVCIAFYSDNRSCTSMLSTLILLLYDHLLATLPCINQLFLSNCQVVYKCIFVILRFFWHRNYSAIKFKLLNLRIAILNFTDELFRWQKKT